jgi:hypothetical protein
MCLLVSDLQYPPPPLFSFFRFVSLKQTRYSKNLWYKKNLRSRDQASEEELFHYSTTLLLPTYLLKTGTPSPPASRLLPPPGSLSAPPSLLLSPLLRKAKRERKKQKKKIKDEKQKGKKGNKRNITVCHAYRVTYRATYLPIYISIDIPNV